jgi:hypothetical protein
VVGLLIAGFVGAALALYAADRVLKARSQSRRMRMMRDRLAAATVRAEEQQAQRQATDRASAALTSVMPAIERPPLTLPGVPPRDAARPRAGCERAGQQHHRAAHPSARAGRPTVAASTSSRSGSGGGSSRTGPRAAAARAGQDEHHRSAPAKGE